MKEVYFVIIAVTTDTRYLIINDFDIEGSKSEYSNTVL